MATASAASAAANTVAISENMFKEAKDIIAALQRADDDFAAAHAAYKAHSEARQRRPAAAPAATATAPSPTASAAAAAKSSSSVFRLSDTMREIAPSASAPGASVAAAPILRARTSLESASDPRLFKIPLLSAPLDMREGRPFLVRVPGMAADMRRGNNAIVCQCQLNKLEGYDRLYMAVNVLDGGGEEGSSQRSVRAHVCIRVDPMTAATSTTRTRLRRRMIFGYRLATHWHVTTRDFKEDDFPVATGDKFWLRLTAHASGFAVALDGVYVGFARHAPSSVPLEGGEQAITLEFPTSGDSGEKPTWKAYGVWTGGVQVDAETEAVIAADLSASAGPAFAPDVVRVTGVPDAASAEEVAAAFAAYGRVGVKLLGGGAASVTLPDPNAMKRVLAEMEGSTAVRGARMHVTQAYRSAATATSGPVVPTPLPAAAAAPPSVTYNPTSPQY